MNTIELKKDLDNLDEETDPIVIASVYKLLYQGVPRTTLVALIVGAVLCFVMLTNNTKPPVAIWYFCLSFTYVFRLITLNYRNKHKPNHHKENLSIFRILTTLCGIAWGLSGLILYPTESSQQAFMAINLMGIASGAIVINAVDRTSAIAFTFSIVALSFVPIFITHHSHISAALLVNMLLYMIIISVTALNAGKHLRENIAYRLYEQKTKEEINLLAQRQQLHIENTPLAVIELDSAFNITFWNAAASNMFGYSAREALNNHVALILTSSSLNLFTDHMQQLVSGLDEQHIQTTNTKKNGGVIHCKWFNTVITNSAGNVTSYAALIQDETAYIYAKQQIERLAYYDALTNLPNRRLLNDRIQHTQLKSDRSKTYACIIFIDIDNFKSLNDIHGHSAGDMLLITTATRLRKTLRASDSASRIGGDEFVVLLEDIGGDKKQVINDCETICEKIIAAINQPIQIKETSYSATASLGVSLFIDSQFDVEDLIKQADAAMYEAKKAGKNRYLIYDDRIQEIIEYKNKIKSDLKTALANNEFYLHYQAQVDNLRQIIGAESLLRWEHPELGNIPPIEFIPLSEDTKEIIPIGTWVLTQACNQLFNWQQHERTKQLRLSVNVSAIQFNQKDFYDTVIAIIELSQCDPHYLTIELTESTVVNDFEDIIQKINQLKKIGIAISLDDFGTGQSSLSVLKNLPLDELKIDRSFVRNLPEDMDSEAIVQTIIAMSKSLDLSITAEGIETEAQATLLLESGCNHLQGYLFSKPLDLESFNQLVVANRR